MQKRQYTLRPENPLFKLVLAIKSFILEVSVKKAHKELDLAYNTAYKVYHKIRETIYQPVKGDGMLSGKTHMDEDPFADKRAGKRRWG